MCRMSTGVVSLLAALLLGPACSSRSGLKPGGGTAGAGATANGGQAGGGVGGTISAGGVVTGGTGGANGGTSGTSTCLVTECPVGEFCVPAGQPRSNLCGCPIPDCEPDGGVGGSAGTVTGGAIGTGGSGGTTGSGDCTVQPGDSPPAVDEVTGLSFSTSSTIPSNIPPPVQTTADATQAQDLYQATLALPVAPTGVQPGYHSCPPNWGVTYQLTFSLANGSTLTVTADPNGCQSVSIPGTCVRSTDSAYWSQLAQDLGIPESEIYPYFPYIVQPPDAGAAACTKDTDCPAGLSCGYAVADGCAAKGVCVQNNCQEGACLNPAGMCGCDGQNIFPVLQSQQLSPNSSTIVYVSAPSSGRIGSCMGIPDAGSAGCNWQGKVIPVGQQVDAGDGCNICECTVAGIACTARACFPPDAPTLVCSLPSALTFGSNGGKVSFQDSFALDTAGHMTVTRNYYSSMDGPSVRTCSPALPACGSSGAIDVSTIAQDLTDADVQFAFGLSTSHVYGVDQRPSDGAVWSITRASGGNILVGTQCPSLYMNSCQPIPAGIQRLADDLRSLAFAAEALPACAGL
jgi:hypothetical protein